MNYCRCELLSVPVVNHCLVNCTNFSVKTCVVKEAGLSGVLLLLDGVGGEGRVASASPSELFEFIL